MKPIRTLLVDDEELARRGLEIRLEKYPDVEICGQAANGRLALEAIAALKPDLVFLDIQMPGMDGFEVLERIEVKPMPAVIFATAFDRYAIDAFEAHALDYLLKPIDDDRLAQALERVREQREQSTATRHRDRLLMLISEMSGQSVSLEDVMAEGRAAIESPYISILPIKDGHRTVRIKADAIEWIEAAGDYMCVHAEGEVHILRGTMKRLEDGLDPSTFRRVHRSTLVNINHVKSLRPHMNGEYFLTLDCGSEIKLSRNYRDCLKQLVPALH
jgi:two-component system LytT family response regulator